MNVRVFASCAALGAILLSAPPARSHHSNVAYEVTKVLEIKGVVKNFRWSNPHTWLTLEVDENGQKVEWAVEGRAPGVLLRAGWSPSILKPGETVTVHFSPAKDGTKVGIIARVTKADGSILANAPPPVR